MTSRSRTPPKQRPAAERRDRKAAERRDRKAAERRGRKAAERRGRKAERLAAWWLRLKGYRILTQGFRAPVGEIDLIAKRGATLAVVEVKARRSLDEARAAITPRQRDRIARATLAYLQRHPVLQRLTIRYDAVLLAPGHRPRHIPDAWR